MLVFVETKRNADFLASFLSQEEFPTTSIHGYGLTNHTFFFFFWFFIVIIPLIVYLLCFIPPLPCCCVQ